MVYINGASKWLAGIFALVFIISIHFSYWVLAGLAFVCLFIVFIARADTKLIFMIIFALATIVYVALWNWTLVIIYGILTLITVWRGHEG